MVTELTDSTFNGFIQSAGTVVVDFTAAWCGPCKMLSPILEDISEELQDGVKLAKIDVDDNPVATEQYGVMSMPTLLVFQNGNLVKQMVGLRPKQVLMDELRDFV